MYILQYVAYLYNISINTILHLSILYYVLYKYYILHIYTHMHTHCCFSLETLDYYRAKVLVLYYFEYFVFHVYLCFLFIWCLLESCDTLVYRCRDLIVYTVVPQYLLEIGSRDP